MASAGRYAICTSLQTDYRASTPPFSFLQAGCPSCRPTNSIKALKARWTYCYDVVIAVLETSSIFFSNWNAAVAINKGMQAVKLCPNKSFIYLLRVLAWTVALRNGSKSNAAVPIIRETGTAYETAFPVTNFLEKPGNVREFCSCQGIDLLSGNRQGNVTEKILSGQL